MPNKEQEKSIRKNNTEIDFEPITHTYSVKGRRLPSVSEIMRPLTDAYYSTIPHAVLDNASNRGTRVHEAIEMYDVLGVEANDKEIKPYLLGYKMAKNVEKFYSIQNEIMLTNGEYCGTLDIIGQLGKDLVIIDLKATSKINYELIEVQLAGYLELAKANGYQIEKTYVCHVKPSSYKFVEIDPNVELWEQLKQDWSNREPN